MSLSRKEFERIYSAELLPLSLATYAIGDTWDWKSVFLFFSYRLEYQAYNIADAFNDADLLNQFRSIPLTPALFPDVDLTSDVSVGAGVTIPSLNGLDVSAKIDPKSIVQFTFGTVKGKSISSLRGKVDQDLDALKTNNFDKYKEKIRGMEVAIGLFYSDDVVLKVNTTVDSSANLKAEIAAQGLAFTASVDTSNVETITIKSSDCPFAAQLMSGRDL